jgi:hypothetical protein
MSFFSLDGEKAIQVGLNQPEVSKALHKQTDPRPRRANHLGQFIMIQSALTVDHLQVIDHPFDSLYLRGNRRNVGPLLGGLDLAGEINNPIISFNFHARQTDHFVRRKLATLPRSTCRKALLPWVPIMIMSASTCFA